MSDRLSEHFFLSMELMAHEDPMPSVTDFVLFFYGINACPDKTAQAIDLSILREVASGNFLSPRKKACGRRALRKSAPRFRARAFKLSEATQSTRRKIRGYEEIENLLNSVEYKQERRHNSWDSQSSSGISGVTFRPIHNIQQDLSKN